MIVACQYLRPPCNSVIKGSTGFRMAILDSATSKHPACCRMPPTCARHPSSQRHTTDRERSALHLLLCMSRHVQDWLNVEHHPANRHMRHMSQAPQSPIALSDCNIGPSFCVCYVMCRTGCGCSARRRITCGRRSMCTDGESPLATNLWSDCSLTVRSH